MLRVTSTRNIVKPGPIGTRSRRTRARRAKRTRRLDRHLRLALAVISRHERGEEDQLVVLPRCGVCGGIISNFDEANLIAKEKTTREDDLPMKRIGTANERDALLLVSDEVLAVHRHCDPGWKPWKPLNTVFKSDQRDEWQKPNGERTMK